MWNTNMSEAPRGREVNKTIKKTINGEVKYFELVEHVMDRIWLAHTDGNVYMTYWIPRSKHTKGRWSGLTENEEGVAWMPYVKPTHPMHVTSNAHRLTRA